MTIECRLKRDTVQQAIHYIRKLIYKETLTICYVINSTEYLKVFLSIRRLILR